jgi:hypothetical protein
MNTTADTESGFDKFHEARLKIDDGSSFDSAYVVMNTLATIVACYGLLADSPAVVIGAMTIAMLLGPISGVARGENALAGGADATKLQLRAEAYNCWCRPAKLRSPHIPPTQLENLSPWEYTWGDTPYLSNPAGGSLQRLPLPPRSPIPR